MRDRYVQSESMLNRRQMVYGLSLSLVMGTSSAWAAPRDVQISEIDFVNNTISITNFGAGTQGLSNWRFCSHDENQVRVYTGSSGFAGMSLESGESLTIHLDNDASGLYAINASSLGGGFAGPLDPTNAYSIGFYFPGGGSLSFGSSDDLADFVQWDLGGVGDDNADFRTVTAVNAGLWEQANEWAVTAANTERLVLVETDNSLLHGASSYLAVVPAPTSAISGLSLMGLALMRRRR